MAKKEKGRATIRIAAVLFLASAVFEILNFNSAVALFGAVRFGAAALLYHFVFCCALCRDWHRNMDSEKMGILGLYGNDSGLHD